MDKTLYILIIELKENQEPIIGFHNDCDKTHTSKKLELAKFDTEAIKKYLNTKELQESVLEDIKNIIYGKE